MYGESPSRLFDVGRKYNRRQDLHALFGGQEQGGISTPADYPLIFLFTGDTGSAFGYEDTFRPDGTFWYTGEGQRGDMTMNRGNRAIRDHQKEGKELHLFEALGDGYARYIGEAMYLRHHLEDRPDVMDELRQAIIFELSIETEPEQNTEVVSEPVMNVKPSRLWRQSLDDLRKVALQQVSHGSTSVERREVIRIRSEAIRIYVLRRAEGVCEGCGKEAPFVTRKNRPFLEAHHTRRLSDGGPDHPRWVIALCPNCHRRIHYGKDGEEYNEQLIVKLGQLERGRTGTP